MLSFIKVRKIAKVFLLPYKIWFRAKKIEM